MRSEVTVRLPRGPSAGSLARQLLDAWLRERGHGGDDAQHATVVLAELVANALRHADPLPDGSVTVSWTPVPEGLHICVVDGGAPTFAHAVRAPVTALSGRGLRIVEALSTRWWVQAGDDDSAVHAVVALTSRMTGG